MLHWFWAVLSLIFTQHAVNTAITGPTASTNPLSHTSLPFLQSLHCFHLLLYTNKQSHQQKQDSCKNHPVAWKNTQRGPWTHRTAPHSRFHPGPSGLNKTPLQRCQGQDFCLVTVWVDVGGRCVYVHRLLMIPHWLLFSAFHFPFLDPVSSHI